MKQLKVKSEDENILKQSESVSSCSSLGQTKFVVQGRATSITGTVTTITSNNLNNVEDDRNRKRRSETEVSKLESKKKRCRKSRKINSKKTKASIAYRTFQKKRKKQILHSKRVEIMNNIERDINHVLGNVFSNYEKYYPIPIVVVHKKLIQAHFGFENCLILNNPRLDTGLKTDICYDYEPLYVGTNLNLKLVLRYILFQTRL